jgi:anti-sigma B factor antagonist
MGKPLISARLDAATIRTNTLASMAPPVSKLMLLVQPPTAYFMVVGRAAVERAVDFKKVVLRLREDGIERFFLDLSQCLLMDSTFAGVLGGLADSLGKTASNSPRISLWRPNERVLDLLDNLDVLSKVRLPAAGESMPGPLAGSAIEQTAERSETTVCCLEAHRYLMALKPENISKFQELTKALEAQLHTGA